MTEQLSIVNETQNNVVSTPAELAALRESKGLSISGTAAQLRLAPRQVEALEQGAWDKLPGLAFIKGALRAYGKFLHADIAPLITSIDQQIEKVEVKADRSLEGKIPETSALGFGEGGSGNKWAWALLAIVGLAVAALYFGKGVDGFMPKKPLVAPAASSDSRSESMNPATISAATPAPGVGPTETPAAGSTTTTTSPVTLPADGSAGSTPASGSSAAPGSDGKAPADSKSSEARPADGKASIDAPPATGNSAVKDAAATKSEPGRADASSSGAVAYRLVFGKDSWVEIRDAAGERVLYGVQRSGTSQTLKGKPPYKAVIGNAVSVKIEKSGGKDPDSTIPMKVEAGQTTARLTIQ